ADAAPSAGSAIDVLAHEGGALSAEAKALDAATGGALARAIAAGRFTGARGQSLELLAPSGVDAARVLVLGAGEAEGLNDQGIESAAASAFRGVQDSGAKELLFRFGGGAARSALCVRLDAYRFAR